MTVLFPSQASCCGWTVCLPVLLLSRVCLGPLRAPSIAVRIFCWWVPLDFSLASSSVSSLLWHFGSLSNLLWILLITSLAPVQCFLLSVVGSLVLKVICMSDLPNQDKVVRDLTSAIENLSIAAQTLSRHVVGETSSRQFVSCSSIPGGECRRLGGGGRREFP